MESTSLSSVDEKVTEMIYYVHIYSECEEKDVMVRVHTHRGYI